MSAATAIELEVQSVVLLRLGDRRFGISANQIAELAAPSRIFKFPHRSPGVEGVILRRGRIVPVCEVAERLLGKKISAHKKFLGSIVRMEDRPDPAIVTALPGFQAEWVKADVVANCGHYGGAIRQGDSHGGY